MKHIHFVFEECPATRRVCVAARTVHHGSVPLLFSGSVNFVTHILRVIAPLVAAGFGRHIFSRPGGGPQGKIASGLRCNVPCSVLACRHVIDGARTATFVMCCAAWGTFGNQAGHNAQPLVAARLLPPDGKHYTALTVRIREVAGALQSGVAWDGKAKDGDRVVHVGACLSCQSCTQPWRQFKICGMWGK